MGTMPLIDACTTLARLGLLRADEASLVARLAADPGLVDSHDGLHLHIRVRDAASETRRLADADWRVELEREGFGVVSLHGISVSVSSIPISHAPDDAARRPRLDHLGVDVPDSAALRRAEQAARTRGWPTVRQGGDARIVSCCYATAEAKLWIFPPIGDDGLDVAIELSLGASDEATSEMGEDLRPARPAPDTPCCGTDAAPVSIRISRT